MHLFSLNNFISFSVWRRPEEGPCNMWYSRALYKDLCSSWLKCHISKKQTPTLVECFIFFRLISYLKMVSKVYIRRSLFFYGYTNIYLHNLSNLPLIWNVQIVTRYFFLQNFMATSQPANVSWFRPVFVIHKLSYRHYCYINIFGCRI